MPLRDHFRPPLIDDHSWETVHGMWPTYIVEVMKPLLPAGFQVGPRVRLGVTFELDAGVRERIGSFRTAAEERGGAATATAAHPVHFIEADLGDYDEYEVLVYDRRGERRLVAAIEIVSPGNKDREESRQAFVRKVALLLREGVHVTIVDPVTVPRFNLYAELLERVGRDDPPPFDPGSTYVATVLSHERFARRPLLGLWHFPMRVGQPWPTVPIRLDEDILVDLPLEPSYEKTCGMLDIP